MYEDAVVAVVVPAYNESGFVGEVIETVPDFVDRVYAIDDQSTDDTWTEIRRTAARENARWSATESVGTTGEPHRRDQEREATDGGVDDTGAAPVDPTDPDAGPGPDGRASYWPAGAFDGLDVDTHGRERVFDRRVVAMQNEANRGVGGSIKAGYRRALEDDVDVVAVMNGDGQMDPDHLDRLVAPVVEGRADYAKGNRLARRRDRSEMSGWRFFGNAVLTFLTRVASGYWEMTDPQNGYTAISRRALETISLGDVYEDYGFLNDLLVRLNVHQFRICDVSIPALYGDERSHIRYSRFVPKLSWLLLRQFLWRLRTRYLGIDFHPLVFLYVLGAVGGLGGLCYAGWTLITGGDPAVHGAIAATELLLSTAIVTVAMVFDRDANSTLVTEG